MHALDKTTDFLAHASVKTENKLQNARQKVFRYVSGGASKEHKMPAYRVITGIHGTASA